MRAVCCCDPLQTIPVRLLNVKRSPREALVLSAATEEETVQIHTGEEEVEVGRPRVFRVFQAEAITCPY